MQPTETPLETNGKSTQDDEELTKELIDTAESMAIETDKGNFTRSRFGSYPRRKGVILVTNDRYKGVIPTGHSAIVYSSKHVIEALDSGVTKVKNTWDKSKSQVYAVTVRTTSAAQGARAANWSYNRIGKPYNWNFYRMDYRGSFYCSQLIRSAFLDLYGIDLNTGDYGILGARAIHSMKLISTSKTSLVYRKKQVVFEK
ncbi:MAG: YiiX/YebB-like N1pC/P60 family cysteine hydrolase [Breznakia sp.]